MSAEGSGMTPPATKSIQALTSAVKDLQESKEAKDILANLAANHGWAYGLALANLLGETLLELGMDEEKALKTVLNTFELRKP